MKHLNLKIGNLDVDCLPVDNCKVCWVLCRGSYKEAEKVSESDRCTVRFSGTLHNIKHIGSQCWVWPVGSTMGHESATRSCGHGDVVNYGTSNTTVAHTSLARVEHCSIISFHKETYLAVIVDRLADASRVQEPSPNAKMV